MTAGNNAIGVPFIELQSVDSTNNYAMRLVHEGLAQHGTTVFAHHQTAGKGQRSKTWVTQPKTNLVVSVVLMPTAALVQPFALSMAVALAAHGLLKKFVGDAVKIKWPNDLFIGDRKAGGILIENSFAGTTWKVAVAGIGLNINQTHFGDLHHKAISLKQSTGETYNTVALAKALCHEIDGFFKMLQTHPHAIATMYHQQLYKAGETVKLKHGARVFAATIEGVNSAGQLVVQHAVEETFDVGAVEWLL